MYIIYIFAAKPFKDCIKIVCCTNSITELGQMRAIVVKGLRRSVLVLAQQCNSY